MAVLLIALCTLTGSAAPAVIAPNVKRSGAPEMASTPGEPGRITVGRIDPPPKSKWGENFGTLIQVSDSDALNDLTTIVGFGGRQWYVIGYKPKGGAYRGVLDTAGGALPSADSCMTLLLTSGYSGFKNDYSQFDGSILYSLGFRDRDFDPDSRSKKGLPGKRHNEVEEVPFDGSISVSIYNKKNIPEDLKSKRRSPELSWFGGNYGGGLNPDGSNAYANSTLKIAMESAYEKLPFQEKRLVLPRNLAAGVHSYDTDNWCDGVAGDEVMGANFWPLSTKEALRLPVAVRIFDSHWWLRSPGGKPDIGAFVMGHGHVIKDSGAHVDYWYAVRPAFNLDLSSVVFTSANPDSTVKFTVEDAGAAAPHLTPDETTNGTSSVGFAYEGAETGANRYISCALEQGGDIKYYGKLANLIYGSGDFTIPLSGVADGTYDLKIFCERANGENETDFVSPPVSMTLVVSDGTGTVF